MTTIRIVFPAPEENYFDIIGYDSVDEMLQELMSNGIIYIPQGLITPGTRIQIAERVIIPLTSIKAFFEMKG